MSVRTQLTKTYNTKQAKKKPKRPLVATSQVDLKELKGCETEQFLAESPETKARERLLMLFEEKVLGEDVNAEMYVQLKAKDALIEQLNSRIITVTGQAQRLEYDSLSAKEKQIKSLLEEKSAIAKRMKALEEKSADLELRLRSSEDTLREEREQLGLLNEALTEETEVLKAQVKDKSEQLRNAKGDILAMSSIVQDLTRLNAELNEKIVALNTEMEKNNTEHYTAIQKAEQVELIEAELLEVKTEQQKMESKYEKMQKEVEDMRETKELVYRVGKGVDEAVVRLSSVDNDTCREVAERLDTLILEMRKAGTQPRDENPERVSTLKSKIKELKYSLESEKRAAAKALSSEITHKSRVTFLTSEHESSKSSFQETINRLQQRLKPMQDIVDRGIAARQELEGKLETCNAELQKKMTEIAYLNEKQSGMKARMEEMRKADEVGKKENKDLRMELVSVASQNAEFEEKNAVREAKTKDALSKLTALSEELWRRDNEILRRETQRLKLVEELTSLKSSVQHNQMRMKFRAAEEMGHINSQLEEKEKEIAALKRMLQSRNQGENADPAPLSTKKDSLTDLEICEKLDQAVRRLKALKDLTDTDDAGNARKKAIAVIRGLQSELKGYRSVVLPEEVMDGTVHLKGLRETLTAKSVSIGELIDSAVGLVG